MTEGYSEEECSQLAVTQVVHLLNIGNTARPTGKDHTHNDEESADGCSCLFLSCHLLTLIRFSGCKGKHFPINQNQKISENGCSRL